MGKCFYCFPVLAGFDAKQNQTRSFLENLESLQYEVKMIELTLTGQVVPKARPRVTRKATFMPQPYRDWKDSAISELLCQSQARDLSSVGIEIILQGKHKKQGDLDNIAGSILDALVQSGILRNDNLSCVHKLSILLIELKEPPSVVIRIV